MVYVIVLGLGHVSPNCMFFDCLNEMYLVSKNKIKLRDRGSHDRQQ